MHRADQANIAITSLWNGEHAPAQWHTNLTVKRRPNHMSIEFTAPWAKNPLPQAPVGQLMGLWEFEVVELFFAGENQRYTELEFGPGGHYLALNFSEVRKPWAEQPRLDYHASTAGSIWRGSAKISYEFLPATIKSWNAYRIFNRQDQRVHMAAHGLPGDKPDFHRLDSFAPCPLYHSNPSSK